MKGRGTHAKLPLHHFPLSYFSLQRRSFILGKGVILTYGKFCNHLWMVITSVCLIDSKIFRNVIFIICLQAFGVPTVVAHVGEKPALFFGSDRFPILAQEINETWMGPEPQVGSSKL